MSTTVSYKGNTIATVNNNTKTLTTQGKYLEADVILTDTSGGTAAISIIDTSDSHGGTVRTITALDISDTTAVASDVAQGKYFYTSDGTKTPGSATIGDSAFIVTLSWDDDYFGQDEGAWVPDATFAQIQAAYTAGKEIVVVTDALDDAFAEGYWDEEDIGGFIYHVSFFDYNKSPSPFCSADYSYDSNGIDGQITEYHHVGDATISSNAQLLNGVMAYGADGTDYTGNIPSKSSSDLTVSGATVTAPAGYYASSATKTVSSGTLISSIEYTDDPSVTVNSSTGVVYVSGGLSTDVNPVTTSGWIDSSTTIPVEVGIVGTHQLSTQAAATITPTTSSQTAVAAGKYTTGAVTVAAMPTGTAGTPTATKGTVSNHSVSITPSVTNTTGYITGSTINGTAVTVSASELVSGSQTINQNGTTDVTNLASVTVAIPIVTYYTGSTAPAASLGQNGDIYLQTS